MWAALRAVYPDTKFVFVKAGAKKDTLVRCYFGDDAADGISSVNNAVTPADMRVLAPDIHVFLYYPPRCDMGHFEYCQRLAVPPEAQGAARRRWARMRAPTRRLATLSTSTALCFQCIHY